MTSFKAKGNPVKMYTEQNCELECRDWHDFLTDSGTKVKYDLGIVVSFGHLIPAHIINLFPLYVYVHRTHFDSTLKSMARSFINNRLICDFSLVLFVMFICSGIINVHASLLPRWRGASPIIHAILNEDRMTGVSVMKIHPHKFDVGEILTQREVPIAETVLMPELHDTLANVGAQLLVECIKNAPASFQNAKPQDDTNVTYGMLFIQFTFLFIPFLHHLHFFLFELFSLLAPRVTDSMAHIDWHRQTAHYICNLYRALYSFKWLTTDWHGRRVKIKEIDLQSTPNVDKASAHVIMSPGRIEYDRSNKCLRVWCSDGSFIRVKKLGLEGKKSEMTALDFSNGFLKKVDRTQRYFV